MENTYLGKGHKEDEDEFEKENDSDEIKEFNDSEKDGREMMEKFRLKLFTHPHDTC